MTASTHSPGRSRGTAVSRLNVGADSWELIWSYAHRVLVVNLGLVVANLPLLVALAVVAQPLRYPVFFGLLSLGVGPSLAAAFGYLRSAETGERASVGEFVRAYRRQAARATARWTITVGLLAVLAADLVLLHDASGGALLVPPLAVTAVLVLAGGILSLALLPLRPDLRLVPSLRIAAFAAVRHWWLTLLSLALLLVAVLAVNQAPLLGLATVPGCALVVTWTNSRVALTRVTADPAGATVEA